MRPGEGSRPIARVLFFAAGLAFFDFGFLVFRGGGAARPFLGRGLDDEGDLRATTGDYRTAPCLGAFSHRDRDLWKFHVRRLFDVGSATLGGTVHIWDRRTGRLLAVCASWDRAIKRWYLDTLKKALSALLDDAGAWSLTLDETLAQPAR